MNLIKEKYFLQKQIISYNKDNNVNFLIYGCGDFGKEYILNTLFDKNLNKSKKKIKYKYNNKELIFTEYLTNNYIEINMEEILNNRDILIKKYIKSLTENNSFKSYINIVIYNIDLLNKKEQFMLRKIIENANNCKFILFCENIDFLIEPIISRCIPIKIDGITNKEFNIFLKNEKCYDNKTFRNIFKSNNNNFKKSLSEYNKEIEIKNINNIFLEENDKDKLLNKIFNFINKKTKMNNTIFEKIDGYIYKLHSKYNLSYDIIILVLNDMLLKQYKNDLVLYDKILDISIDFNLRCKKGSREIFHIKSYIFKIKYILNI